MALLRELIQPAQLERCGDRSFPVLSMTMHDGIMLQSDRFKKSLASVDQSAYKVVRRNQLVVGFPIDEGVLYIQQVVDAGIMSPAYDVWNVDETKVNLRYFELCLHSPQSMMFYKTNLRGTTARRRSLPKETLLSLPVPVPSMERQREIASALDRLQALIRLRQHQRCALDQLIKARFVEMFGDPVHNSAKLPVLPMTEVCEIIDGDRGKNYPKQEEFYQEEYCLFLNAKNVTSHGFDFSECMFITKGKDEMLRKGKLRRGDVVLTTRGTLGNLAFYTDAVPFENVRINSGMVILRMNKEIMNECFFIEQFRMQVEDIKKSIASGSAQPQLPISTMNKIIMLLPDMNRQKQFAAFVSQVDKSKLSIQASLDQLETLKQSLMQKYFG